MTGAVLRLLQNSGRSRRGDGCGDIFSPMSDDYDSFFCAKRGAGSDNLLDQRAASGAMQDFGEARFEARAFAGGENDYS